MENKFPNFRTKKVEDFCYTGKIFYSADNNEINYWCKKITEELNMSNGEQKHIGFDMEWPINKRTSVIQIYSQTLGVFVFQILTFTLPNNLINLILDNSIKKVGLNIANDIRKLSKDFNYGFDDVILHGLCDIGELANQKLNNPERWSLANLVFKLSGQNLPKPKNIRCGKWDEFPLKPEQIKYAGLDSYASHWVFQKLNDN